MCFFFLMIRRPPSSTRPDTLLPHTTLFRSDVNLLVLPVDSEGVGVEGQPLTQPLRAQRQLVIPYIFGVIDMRRRAAGIHPAAARTIAALDDSRQRLVGREFPRHPALGQERLVRRRRFGAAAVRIVDLLLRSEEHTSELQSLMRISSAVFCLKKKNIS